MKIGILGGTFNPPHLGHIKLAQEAQKKLKLDKVVFVPAYVPPHKSGKDMVSWQDRYKMAGLSIGGVSNFEVSDIEIRLKGTSYSINTIKEFKKLYGDKTEVFFIAGSDYADELKSWKDIDDLKRLCTFIIATRPGYRVVSPPANTELIEADTPDISSTEIRKRIREGASFAEHVAAEVYNYIINKRLYT